MSDYFTPDGYLSAQEIRKELKNFKYGKAKLSEEQVSDIVESFWFQDYYSNFICIPEVFKLLKQYLQTNGPSVKRIDLYRFYFLELISDQDKWKSLELIAVDFEMMQRNDIDEATLEKVLVKHKIENISLVWLKEKNLVWEKDGKTEWRHHTYTEFFASEYILKQKNPIEIANDLVVLYIEADKSHNIKPSWHGVIKFLLQSEIANEVLDWLLSLIEENQLNLNENLTNIISVFGPTDLSSQDKERIFNIIYDTYQERMVWLPVWARTGLANYFTSVQLKKFEKHLKPTKDEVETYVHRGNVVAIVGELIELGIISDHDQVGTWKKRFIQFALDKNDNGVLQRHSLKALSQFTEKDGELILELRSKLEPLSLLDSLVRDAFIQYCAETAPNTKEAIDVFADVYGGGMARVYSRNGMYEISTLEGFSYLIDKLISDGSFLHEFIDSESIFDGNKKDPDAKLVQRILKMARSNSEFAQKLSELLKEIIKNDKIYQVERSYFVKNISLFIFEDRGRGISFIKDVIGEEETTRHFVHNFFDILPEILTTQNWKEIFSILEEAEIEYVDRYLESAVYRLRFQKERGGKELFQVIAEKKGYKVEKPHDYEKEEEKRKAELYKEFKFKIEPEKGRFMGDVFEYYLNNSDLIEERWSDYERERLLFLAYEDGIKRLDPRDFKVNFEEKKKRGGRFRWSSQAAFYGEMIKVVQKIDPSLLEESDVRQHIIDFTPYCYSYDYKVVHDLITSIEPNEISWLVELYKDEDDDRRYLVPESFVYFFESLLEHKQNISSAIPTLRTFILDENISDWVSRSALELLGKIEDQNKDYLDFLEDIFIESDHDDIKEEANKQLIIFFKKESAISWRFDQIKAKMVPFKRERGVHSVGELESELDSRSFISPLYEVKTESVFQNFLKLFNYVVSKYQTDDNYSSYLEYVWSSIIRFMYQLDEESFFEHHALLKKYIDELAISSKKKPYLEYSLQNVRQDFVNKIAKEGDTHGR